MKYGYKNTDHIDELSAIRILRELRESIKRE